jgi:hypothetical protein
MSSTPPKKDGVEPPQSPDDDQHMDRNAEDTQAQGLGYEFEVKEQDRWLPIANGAYLPRPPPVPAVALFCPQHCPSARRSIAPAGVDGCPPGETARLPRQTSQSPPARAWQ